jgi:hypothetical protein
VGESVCGSAAEAKGSLSKSLLPLRRGARSGVVLQTEERVVDQWGWDGCCGKGNTLRANHPDPTHPSRPPAPRQQNSSPRWGLLLPASPSPVDIALLEGNCLID